MASLFARRNKKSDSSSSKLVSGPSALTPRAPHYQTSPSMQASSPATPLYERFARTGSTAPSPSQHSGGARGRTESVVSAYSSPRALQSNRASRADDGGLEGGYVNVNLNVAKSPGRASNVPPPLNSPAKSQRSLPKSIAEKPLPEPAPGPSSISREDSNRAESSRHQKYLSSQPSTSSLRNRTSLVDRDELPPPPRISSAAYMSSEDEDFEAPERTRGRTRTKTSPLPTVPSLDAEPNTKLAINTLVNKPSSPAISAKSSSHSSNNTSTGVASPAASTPTTIFSATTSPVTAESSTTSMTTISQDGPSSDMGAGAQVNEAETSVLAVTVGNIPSPKIRKKYSPLAAFGGGEVCQNFSQQLSL
ncbi:hypothetical protein SCHPADRAFT_277563 [Schizopora paradoxa]|uniref:Uncharacterized protein n=1 Tax=Schizopora paradoxa TaxID=27342 RepID=A0A0H2RT58_9AGAM|nr:hypothetical protein SCHPADRAFT_277563 [Schizopora paradoxa]